MKKNSVIISCDICTKPVSRQKWQILKNVNHFCSTKCYGEFKKTRTKENSTSWKGGKITHIAGYIRTKVGVDHPMAGSDGYVLEHRLVMSNHLNRQLEPEEVVHHINHIRNDNRIENLMLVESNSEHQKLHWKEFIPTICWCGGKHEAHGLCNKHYKQMRQR